MSITFTKPTNAIIVIVTAQFFCTSSWFAVNAIITEISQVLAAPASFLSEATIAIQLGFIIGTLFYATLGIADRFSPSKVFFISSILVALCNTSLVWQGISVNEVLITRVFTGFFLAGIYPIGMKIASDYFEKGLGISLGFLVGALVLGTALPHLIKGINLGTSWQYIIYGTSALTLFGGIAILLLVPDGPYKRPAPKFEIAKLFDGFKDTRFRKAAIGYFGHMWEVYAFWAFIPALITAYTKTHTNLSSYTSIFSFLIIASGSLGCISSGFLAQRYSTKTVALSAIAISGSCCLLLPVVFTFAPYYIFACFVLIWGAAASADSPQFSTMVAQFAPQESRGTAITLVTCLGFATSIFSIQLVKLIMPHMPIEFIFIILALGSFAAFIAEYKKT